MLYTLRRPCNVHSNTNTASSSGGSSSDCHRPIDSGCSRLGLSHWDPYTLHRGGCLELYYCNMVEWSWWDSSLICKTNWFPWVLWHYRFGHM